MEAQRTREKLAWAAGLFEGEGCFSSWETKERNRKLYLHSTLSSTDEDVVKTFQHTIGFGNISGPHAKSNKAGKAMKPFWRWRACSFEHNQALIALLWPWLHYRRREKAKEILLAWKQCRDLTKTKRLTSKQISEIKDLLASGSRQIDIVRAYNLSDGYVSLLANNKRHPSEDSRLYKSE